MLPPSPQHLKQRKGKSRLHSNKANTSYLLEENNRNHYYIRLQTWVAASQIILWQVQTLQSQPVSLVSYQKRNCSLGACRQSRYMRCDRVSIKRLRFWVQKGISDACTLTDCPRTLQSVLPWNFTFISAKDALFLVHRPDFSSPILLYIDPFTSPLFIVARRWVLIIKVSRYINCEGFKFLLIQSVYWNIHIICVCRILWSPLLKLGVRMCVCILNYMISRNITVYFWSPKTNNNISVLCGLVQCFYLECLCWFINEFLITTFRAITFWILDDVNDAFHFEETYLLLLIFEPQRFCSRTQLHSVKPCEIKGKEWLNTLVVVS